MQVPLASGLTGYNTVAAPVSKELSLGLRQGYSGRGTSGPKNIVLTF